MRKFKFWLFILPLVVMFVTTSCGDNDDDDPPAPPTLIVQETGVSAKPGDTARFTINASTNAVLTSVKVTSSVGGSTPATEMDSTLAANIRSFTHVYRHKVSETATPGMVIELVFTATDNGGRTSTERRTITVAEEYVLYETGPQAPFRVYNIMGPNPGAFNLMTMTPATVNDPNEDKDFVDQTVVAANFSRSFAPGAGNGSTYVKARPGFNFNTSNSFTAHQEYSAQTPMNIIVNIQKNDVYIVNLRGTGQYAVVKIVDVVETANNNNDYIQFHVRRKPL